SDFMLKHRLKDRYVSVDDVLTDERVRAVALDKANAPAREVLLGAASERSKFCLGKSEYQGFLKHSPEGSKFYYGPNARKD
ncbi:hypothetical protein, partial [Staphylococcus aureus]